MTEVTLPTTLMNEAMTVAAEALGTRLASKQDVELMAVSRGAMAEANDPGFTDAHRLHRFALHLLVEAELDRRLTDRQKTRDKHLATMMPQELAAHEEGTREKSNVLPWPKKMSRAGSL
ncbi:hypothetical protein RAH32_19775 [Paracoccus sp. WLY502]|jgi:hypothetical protein|uniref:hypothetical protein n=1 Tax=Paracoccus yibinensis TaxID=3068891 RepID=UPI00279657A4|nr:hypothetical protein [Paracoccus sp. WLY502]MDQ1902665.1 hypothetical protein [Paracoccus sp. WLY502]